VSTNLDWVETVEGRVEDGGATSISVGGAGAGAGAEANAAAVADEATDGSVADSVGGAPAGASAGAFAGSSAGAFAGAGAGAGVGAAAADESRAFVGMAAGVDGEVAGAAGLCLGDFVLGGDRGLGGDLG